MQRTFWWRYRDDVISVWMHGQDKLTQSNSSWLFPSTNLMCWTWLCILIMVSLKLCLLETHRQLSLFSALQCAPLPLQNCVPFNVALKMKRNCSSSQFYERRKTEYASYLVQQGYSDTLVQKEFVKVHALSRDSLIYPATVCKSKLPSFSLCA